MVDSFRVNPFDDEQMKQSSNVAMASCNSYLWVHPNPMNPMTCNENDT